MEMNENYLQPYVSRITLTAFTMVLLNFIMPEAIYAQSCNCFFVRDTQDKLTMEKLVVANNRTEVVSDPGLVTIAFTMGAGMNGDMIAKNRRPASLVAKCADGMLSVSLRQGDGQEKTLPEIPTRELSQYIIRVNVKGANGTKKVFRISDYSTVEDDTGPVVDMFGGALPLGPGDYSVTTETRPKPQSTVPAGAVAFKKVAGWVVVPLVMPDGSTRQFVVDLAATRTVIGVGMLANGAAIRRVEMVEHKDGKSTTQASGLQAATGSAALLGRAQLSRCKLGSIPLAPIEVNVMRELPSWLTEQGVEGILGADVLQMAVGVTFTGLDTDAGTLIFGPVTSSSTGFTLRQAGGLYFVSGQLDGAPIDWLIDTGARYSIVNTTFVKQHNLTLTVVGERDLRGLDGAIAKSQVVKAATAQIGSQSFSDVPLCQGDLAALKAYGLQGETAILGMDFLSRFSMLSIDFRRGEISWK